MSFPWLKDVLKEVVARTSESLQVKGYLSEFPLNFYPGFSKQIGETIYLNSLNKENPVLPCISLIFDSNSPKRKFLSGVGMNLQKNDFSVVIAIETKEYSDIDLRYSEKFSILELIKDEFLLQLNNSPLIHKKYEADLQPDIIDLPEFRGFPGADRVDCYELQNLSINIYPLKN